MSVPTKYQVQDELLRHKDKKQWRLQFYSKARKRWKEAPEYAQSATDVHKRGMPNAMSGSENITRTDDV